MARLIVHEILLDSSFAEFETAAHEAATSTNARPLPSKAQEIAGNYRKGHARWHGIPVSVENVRNSWRSGTAEDGTPWTNRLAAHYGDFPGTVGADGDPVDVFVGPFPELTQAWVINQRRVAGQSGFDEHKVMVGFTDEEQARLAYLHSYQRNWQGLMSMVPITVGQLKWWLKHGDMSRPLAPDHLPSEGISMKKVLWNHDATPVSTTLADVLADVRSTDPDGMVLDAVTMDELLSDPDLERVAVLDAMVVEAYQMGRKMAMLSRVMAATGSTVKPSGDPVISDPVRLRGVLQVMVLFPMSDGQSVAIWFHNPDTTPGRLTPLDELISWKWMLNKKDVTIVVAPERGQDLNVREVARRIMRLVERNSDAFQRANAKAAERAAEISALEEEIPRLEARLADLQRKIEVAEVQAEGQKVGGDPAPALAPAPGSATLEQGQAALKSLAPFLSRGQMSAVRELMRGEEGQFFVDKMIELAERIATMPHTYQQDGKGDEAVAYLHYFKGGADWYITEKDKDGGVDQAFGQADLGYGPELGYISIAELVANGVELDFHFEPKALGSIKGVEVKGEEPAVEEPKVQTVAALTGTELGEFPDTPDGLKDLRAAAVGFFAAMLGQWYPCPALGGDVEMRKAGMLKVKSLSADPRKLKLVPALRQLMATAVKIESASSYMGAAESNIVAYHTLRSLASLGGASLAVRMIVKEDDKGKFHWDHTVHSPSTVLDSAMTNGSSEDDPSATPNYKHGARSVANQVAGDQTLSADPMLDSISVEEMTVKLAAKAADEEGVLSGAAQRAAAYLNGAVLDFAGGVDQAVEQLKIALDVVTTNEPINRAAGAVEQADLERESAEQFSRAIAILEARRAPVLDAAGGPRMVFNLFIEGEPPEVLPEDPEDEADAGAQPDANVPVEGESDPAAIPEGQVAGPPAVTPEMIARAAELGALAAGRGVISAPALDPDFMAMIPDGAPVGWSMLLLDAWIKAFSEVRAKEPVQVDGEADGEEAMSDPDGRWAARFSMRGALFHLQFHNPDGSIEEWDYSSAEDRKQAVDDMIARAEGREEPPQPVEYTNWADWEGDLFRAIEELGEMDHSDAQGVAMVHPDVVQAEWEKRTSPAEVARMLLELPAGSAQVSPLPPGVAEFARQRELDREYLQSFIDGTADVFAADALSRMEPMTERYADDAEMMALFTRAAQAYSDAAVVEAQRALTA